MLARILGSIVFLVLLVVGVIFASILLAVAAAVVFVAVIYLWWKAKRLQSGAPNDFRRSDSGHTIEGEYSIDEEAEKQELAERLPPSDQSLASPAESGKLRQ